MQRPEKEILKVSDEPEPAKRGPPTKYRVEFAEQARKLTARGAFERDLADWFGVTMRTISNWRLAHDDFRAALEEGREIDAERVERSFYQRCADGYEYDSEHVQVTNSGQVVRVPIRVHVPPDPSSQRWLLANRRPDRWKLQPNGKQPIDMGDLKGAEGLTRAAEAVLMALARGDLEADAAMRIIDAIGVVGEQRQRFEIEARLIAIENPGEPKQLPAPDR